MGKKEFAATLDELALRYQVNRNSVKKWIEEGAPRKTERGYRLSQFDEWVEKNKTVGADDDTKIGLEKQKLTEVIRRLRRENEVEEGKLLKSGDVADAVFRMTARSKAVLLRFPKNIGARLGVEAEKMARAVVQETLRELEAKPI